MDSGFAAGFITYGNDRKRGIHEPLITEAEWEAYLEARGRRRTYRRTERSEYLFSGLVYCDCGSKMHGGQYGGTRGAAYRCKDGKEKRKHPGRYVMETTIETAVRSWLVKREARLRKEVANGLGRNPIREPADPTAEITAQLARLAEKQVRLAEQRVEAALPLAAYETLRDRYAAEAESLSQQLRTVNVRKSAPLRVLPVLLERWEDISVPERREYLRALIARIEVSGDRASRAIEIVPLME